MTSRNRQNGLKLNYSGIMQNSMTLNIRIVRLDHYSYGPYYDSFEGVINGIIHLGIDGASFTEERLIIDN